MNSEQKANLWTAGERPRLLVVDDDPAIRKVLERVLSGRGLEIVLAENGEHAKALLGDSRFDLVLTDIHMPKMDGIAVLRAVREVDPDFPVILFTACPSADTAIGALQLRATAYLTKPLEPGRLVEEVEKALRLTELARVRKQTHEVILAAAREESARSQATDQFDRALAGLFMAYQPIVTWSDRRVFGYEALVRSKEPSLPHPGALFEAAERLNRWDALGRSIRRKCVEPLAQLEPGVALFVNLHARELLDETLFDPCSALAQVAGRVVLELTERAHIETVADAERRIARLRELGFRIAIDDIGAGYSGLNSFAMLRPDLVKLDMALIRNIDSDPVKCRLAALLVQLCRDLGIAVVGEGVETVAERQTLTDLGCDLLQGYLFGRPSPAFATPSFDGV